jgi:hypothetical protein
MARVLAKHAGVSLDDIERLDHARGVRTKDGAYTVALFGAPVRGLVVKHRQIRVTRGLKSLAVADVEDLLVEADKRLDAYWTAVNVSLALAQWVVALEENEIVLSSGRTLHYDETWKVFK